jgi:hypothetical protein
MSTVAVALESFPPKSKFTVDNIPDLSDKVIIVTGANSGLGFDTAKVSLPRVFHHAHANGKQQ